MNRDAQLIAEAYKKLLKESHPDSTQTYDDDLDDLYTIIENALAKQDINSQQLGDYLSVNYYNKGYKITVTPL